MSRFAIVLGAILCFLPNVSYLADLRYRFDPALERSVCRNLICSDRLLLDAADRFPGSNEEDRVFAIATLQEALRRDVGSADRWCDLGDAFLAAGRVQEAEYSFKRAVALAPQSPPVFWRAAQFYSRTHELARSQEYLGKMLALVPKYKELVFDIYAAPGSDVVAAFESGIPREGPLAQDYFRYLLTHNASLQDVKRAWEWVQQHGLADDRLAGDYVDWLSNTHEYLLAAETWKHSVGRHDDSYLNPNLVFNGSFESSLLQVGLDWKITETAGVLVSRDSTVAFSGSSSLQIEFDESSNIDFHSVAHEVVTPAGRYHFKAMIRTSDLLTDQGIGFRLVDSAGAINAQTARVTGTHDWTPVEVDLTVPAPVRLLQIEVVRQPSWKFDNKVRGKVWIDAVSLVRL